MRQKGKPGWDDNPNIEKTKSLELNYHGFKKTLFRKI